VQSAVTPQTVAFARRDVVNLQSEYSVKLALKLFALALFVLVLLGGGAYAWVSHSANQALARTIPAHTVEFPVPFPVPEEDVAAQGLTAEEAEGLALERALERGRHLVEARYACVECHGEDFGGGVMVDAFPIGRLLGPNLTSGRGGVTSRYTVADWDRIVRHGILPDGRPTVMPSEDFLLMSDQELSDIVAYIRSLPPVDNDVPGVRLGPLGKVLVATGQIHLSADMMEDHHEPHAERPPPAEVSVEFGRHLAAVCTGCHGPELLGGPIVGGDPSWPPAANLTPHPDGLAGWGYEDFVRAMREAVRPDGREILPPMSSTAPFAQRMTDVELEAMWTYLTSLEPRPTPE
jgi:mono/diheme cytochrome c family protein